VGVGGGGVIAMAEICPDCERPRPTHGYEEHDDDFCVATGTVDSCQPRTITRLRRELANALAVNSGRTYCMHSPEVLKARVVELEGELAKYQALVADYQTLTTAHETLERELAEARAIGELERAALERSVQARQAELRLREHHPDNAIQTEHWKRRDAVGVAEAIRSNAVDALLAARAATGEKEADRG